MAILNRDGFEIYYETHGHGPALLLSHGFGASSAMWQYQIGELSRDRQVIAWDMRGHGASSAPDDPARYSQALSVADMAALLDHCRADRAILCGMSLGGYMSLAFNLAHAHRVRALILVDTGPGFKNEQARADWNAYSRRRAESYDRDGLAAQSDSPEVRMAQHPNAIGIAHAARGMLTQQDDRVIQSLPQIAVPTLVVVGADDERYLASSGYMAGKIPGAGHVVVDNARHAPNVDQPGEFNAAVRTFLQNL